jgi:hypothetical protein
VVGVGVTDGLGVAHDGVGDAVGDGDAVGTRLRSSSSVFSWPAEAALVGLPVVVGAATTGAGEADTVLVRAVVTGDAQLEEADGLGDAPPLDEVAPTPRAVLCAPAGVVPEPGAPLPLPVCEPLPSVAAPPGGCDGPLKTVLLAWMIAWRKGCTPNDTLAMIAIPASTTTGRSQPTLSSEPARPDRARPSLSSSPGRGSRRSRGNDSWRHDNWRHDKCGNDRCRSDTCGSGNRDTRGSVSPAAAGSAVGHAQLQCHDQCPRQTQFLAASRVSTPTVSHHGRGGRPPILARIRSSPSGPGSIPPTASASPRRSDSSMPPSGVVMPSPARLRRPS